MSYLKAFIKQNNGGKFNQNTVIADGLSLTLSKANGTVRSALLGVGEDSGEFSKLLLSLQEKYSEGLLTTAGDICMYLCGKKTLTVKETL